MSRSASGKGVQADTYIVDKSALTSGSGDQRSENYGLLRQDGRLSMHTVDESSAATVAAGNLANGANKVLQQSAHSMSAPEPQPNDEPKL